MSSLALRSSGRIACTLLVAVMAGACATRQAIPIECVTESVEIWVDGRLIEGNPNLLELSTDDPHTVLVKAPGHRTQLYVFEPEEGPDGTRLAPDALCVDLVPVGQGRELELEIDDPSSP